MKGSGVEDYREWEEEVEGMVCGWDERWMREKGEGGGIASTG